MPSDSANVSLVSYEKGNRLTPDVIEFELFGKPTPKGRPRFNTRTGRAYTPTKTRDAEQSILAAYLVASAGRLPHDGAIEIELDAVFTPPTSWPKWKREAALAGEFPHTTRPDFDNLAKIIDGLNGRAWVDDSQIIHAVIRKAYGQTATTRVRIIRHPSIERNHQ